jgi:hypothetical protein
MTAPTLYRIIDTFEYLDREDEYTGLTLEEAAARMDDLTGVGADLILSDWDEPCERCEGIGSLGFEIKPGGPQGFAGVLTSNHCPDCGGTGKWPGPWKWTDPETGREFTMMREVE